MAAAPAVRRSELAEALRACRSAFIGVGLISCMINLLYLTGSMFMLQVYDRVLPSRSVPNSHQHASAVSAAVLGWSSRSTGRMRRLMRAAS